MRSESLVCGVCTVTLETLDAAVRQDAEGLAETALSEKVADDELVVEAQVRSWGRESPEEACRPVVSIDVTKKGDGIEDDQGSGRTVQFAEARCKKQIKN